MSSRSSTGRKHAQKSPESALGVSQMWQPASSQVGQGNNASSPKKSQDPGSISFGRRNERGRELYPSFSAASRRPACSAPRERCRALSKPEPGGKKLFGEQKQPGTERAAARTPLTCVVAVMESTKVGTVEQLRFRRRPWGEKTKNLLLSVPGACSPLYRR